MRLTNSCNPLTVCICRFILVAIFVALLLNAMACGTATPTRPPASPTRLAPTQPPTPIVQPTAPIVQPTAPTVAALTATATITATVPVTPTVARATRTPAPARSPTPKPAVLSGRIGYSVVRGAEPRLHAIWVANVDGSAARQVLTHAYWPAFSPDGSRLAYFGRPEGKSEGLYVANADGGNPVLAVIHPGVCCINWSRDGNWIVYALSARATQPGGPIWKVKVDGVYRTRIDLRVEGNGPAFSPDGSQIVYSGCLPGTNTCGVFAAPSDGSGGPRVITRDNGGNAQWSPDGKRIVYQATDDAGKRQVFVINADGSGTRKQLTKGTSNDGQPVWSRDGGSIFWRSDQNGTAWAIFVMNADGSNPRRILSDVPPDRDLWGWESLSVAP